MKLQTASRKQAPIKLAIQGPSGSGKTYSSLLLAYGLTQNWSTIAVIDTENNSASLYAHLGAFKTLGLSAPFTPEKYMEAIALCTDEGMEVIIIDSISHEWDGVGGILDIHGHMSGNSFANWSKVSPRHHLFMQSILQCPRCIIATVRTKQDYILQERNGRQIPEKVGLKSITRDGMDYEFTLVFDVNVRHQASVSKDRTRLFLQTPEFVITPQTGELIKSWCMEAEPVNLEDEILACTQLQELISLYGRCTASEQLAHRELFTARKEDLQRLFHSQKAQQHGTALTH